MSDAVLVIGTGVSARAVIADALQRAPANDYLLGLGEPWLLLSPEHAAVLAHHLQVRVPAGEHGGRGQAGEAADEGTVGGGGGGGSRYGTGSGGTGGTGGNGYVVVYSW